MHHCLLVSEIFQIIADFSHEDHSTAALALTCRAFYEPAQDLLWKNLRGIAPLVGCFSSEVCSNASGNICFARFPKETDWDRFNHHARRVRKISFGQELNPSSEARALQVLELCRSDADAPLLPNLRELYWIDLKASAFRFLSLFVHPGLITFHALVIANPRLFSDILIYLSKTSPGLRNLRISPGAADNDDPDVCGAYAKVLHSLTGIEELAIKAPVSPDTLPFLAQLPHLQTLSARLPSHFSLPSRIEFEDVTFPSLRKFSAYAEQVDDVLPLLDLVKSSSFAELSVHVKVQPQIGSLEQLFAIAARHKTLEVIQIMLVRSPGERAAYVPQKLPQHMLCTSTLRVLLGLNHLSQLILPQIPTELDDKFLLDASAAWPCLEKLTLGTMARTDNMSVSLNAIRQLIARSARLTDLALTFNSALNDNTEAAEPSSSRLRMFDIGCSPIRDTRRFASFVVATCPHAWVCDPHGPQYRGTSLRYIRAEVSALKGVEASC